jgi:hypothetical protein
MVKWRLKAAMKSGAFAAPLKPRPLKAQIFRVVVDRWLLGLKLRLGRRGRLPLRDSGVMECKLIQEIDSRVQSILRRRNFRVAVRPPKLACTSTEASGRFASCISTFISA